MKKNQKTKKSQNANCLGTQIYLCTSDIYIPLMKINLAIHFPLTNYFSQHMDEFLEIFD